MEFGVCAAYCALCRANKMCGIIYHAENIYYKTNNWWNGASIHIDPMSNQTHT